MVWYMGLYNASKYLHMLKFSLLPLHTSKSSSSYTIVGRSIQNIYNTGNCFGPKIFQQVSKYHHTSYYIHDVYVFPLRYAILLGHVPSYQSMLDVILLQEIIPYNILFPSIISQHLHFLPTLRFNIRFKKYFIGLRFCSSRCISKSSY